MALSPINQRRWNNFRANRRGYVSLWVFCILFLLSLFAEFIANDRPIFLRMEGKNYFPAMIDYTEQALGGEFDTLADYRDPYLLDLFRQKDAFIIWAPIRNSYSSITKDALTALPSPPTWWLRDRLPDCGNLKPGQAGASYCALGNWNWLGTDNAGRDVVARLLYGFRLSVIFGLLLTLISSVIGIAAGAIQGYFGGLIDLTFQRVIEIWHSLPTLYLLIIISSFLKPSFLVLLVILLLFHWVHLIGVVRAEFLRARNLEYVRAARALGVSNAAIMWRHMLPNAMVSIITFLPFELSGSVLVLTSLDFLGLGLPVGSPSLGELLHQGKTYAKDGPWLGITGFLTVAGMLSLLIFIGEAARDAFDPRKTFR